MRTDTSTISQKRMLVSILLLAWVMVITGCGEGEKAPSESGQVSCCKVCKTGKACGDSCISTSKTCSKGQGCACNGLSSKTSFLSLPDSIPLVFTSQLSHVAGLTYSSGAERGIIQADGNYTYELGEPVTFTIEMTHLTVEPGTYASVFDLAGAPGGEAFVDKLIQLDTDRNTGNGIQLPLP